MTIYEESKQTIIVNRLNIDKYFGPLIVTPALIDKTNIIDLTYDVDKTRYVSKTYNVIKDKGYTLNISLDNSHEAMYLAGSYSSEPIIAKPIDERDIKIRLKLNIITMN